MIHLPDTKFGNKDIVWSSLLGVLLCRQMEMERLSAVKYTYQPGLSQLVQRSQLATSPGVTSKSCFSSVLHVNSKTHQEFLGFHIALWPISSGVLLHLRGHVSRQLRTVLLFKTSC